MTTPLKSDKEELADLRKIAAEHPDCRRWFCIHHDILLETLHDDSTVEDRIAEILRSKPAEEHATRFRNLRPFVGELPTAVAETWAACSEARAARDKAGVACDKAFAAYAEAATACDKAVAARDEAVAACAKAWVARNEALAAYDEALAARDEAVTALNKACTAYDEAGAALNKARAAYDEAGAALNKARAARDKAWTAYNKSWAAYREAVAAHADEITDLMNIQWPGNTWNGKNIGWK